MKVLIIGASGLIGSSLLMSLKNEDIQVLGTSSQRSGPNIQLLDPLNSAELYEFLIRRRFGTIVNCASKGVIRRSATTSEMQAVNTELPRKLAEALLRLDSSCRLVHLSSSTEPLGIETPESEYANSKKEGTLIVEKLLGGSGHILNTARIHNVYSSAPLPKRFITETVIAALKGVSISLDYPDRKRDFVHLNDVVSSLKNIILSPSQVSTKHEIGTGMAWSLETVAQMIFEMAGRSRNLVNRDSAGVNDMHPYEVAGNKGFEHHFGSIGLPDGLQMLLRSLP